MTATQKKPGYVTKFGYRRVRDPRTRRLRMEHVVNWERANGPVPKGKELHHINGDKLDNRLENLQLVTRLEHKRIHSGCQLRDGEWWKKCRVCREFKPVSDYYQYPGRNGVMGLCKPCASRQAVEYKRKRRRRALAAMAMASPLGMLPPVVGVTPNAVTETTPTRAGAVEEVVA